MKKTKTNNKLNICLLNNNCLLFEQVYLSIKTKYNIVNFQQEYRENAVANLAHQKEGLIFIDLHYLNILNTKINTNELIFNENIPLVLFLKRDQQISGSLLNDTKIKHLIILPCSITEIISQIEFLTFKIDAKDKIIERTANQSLNIEKSFVEKLEKVIDSQLELVDISVKAIASKLNVHPNKLNEMVKKISGLSAVQFILKYRLEVAKEILEEQEVNIKEVAIKTCFLSLSYFTKAFKNNFGVLPSQHKQYSILAHY